MPRDTINDLQAFVAVAREQSFTKAATVPSGMWWTFGRVA